MKSKQVKNESAQHCRGSKHFTDQLPEHTFKNIIS